MRCEYIYRLSYNIYVYYVHQWNGGAHRSGSTVLRLALAMKSVPVDCTTRQRCTHAHIHCSR